MTKSLFLCCSLREIKLIWFGLAWFVCAVHKQRDIVPLDVNDDTDDSSDEDDVQPVFDLKVRTFPLLTLLSDYFQCLPALAY